MAGIIFPLTSAYAQSYGNCDITDESQNISLETLTPNTLTVRPYLPAPGYWNGTTLDNIKDGFEYCLAANIAHQAGLENLKLVSVSFAQVIAGQTSSFDIAISQTTITDERKEVVDFTVPYSEVVTGVLARAGEDSITNDNFRDQRIGTERGTTMVDFINDVVQPSKQVQVYTDTASMYAALASKQIDAAIFDAETLLSVAAKSDGRFEVIATLAGSSGEIGGVVTKGSQNLENFNKIISVLKENGTIDRLAHEYLDPIHGGVSIQSIPQWTFDK